MTLSRVLYNALSPEYKKSTLFQETKTVKTCTQKLIVLSTIFMTTGIRNLGYYVIRNLTSLHNLPDSVSKMDPEKQGSQLNNASKEYIINFLWHPLGKYQNLLERLNMECDMMNFKESDGHVRRQMELVQD